MATDNKSLGKFKLTGIPPAPRGVPQIQVAFDVDANGILLVTALDRNTGREQSITIQGASTLSEAEVNKMVQEAEKFANSDRKRKERVEKRTRAEALTLEAERELKQVALDFGMQFARNRRQRIEVLVRQLRDYLNQDSDRGIDQSYADLKDALADLNREVRQYYSDDDDGGNLFDSIRRVFSDDDDDYDPPQRRDRPYSSNDEGFNRRRPQRPSYQDNWDDNDDNWL